MCWDFVFVISNLLKVKRMQILNSLRCAVIHSKMPAHRMKCQCLTNQECAERVACQKHVFVKNKNKSCTVTFPRFSTSCCIVVCWKNMHEWHSQCLLIKMHDSHKSLLSSQMSQWLSTWIFPNMWQHSLHKLFLRLATT